LGLKVALLVGGEDMRIQEMCLKGKPHVVVGTPGRVADHLRRKDLNLRGLKFLVLDESDELLRMGCEQDIKAILVETSEERQTLLFSATMTDSIESLIRAGLKDPVRINISKTYDTVDTLTQKYILVPFKFKETYLYYLLNNMRDQSVIVFVNSCLSVQTFSLFLKNMDLDCQGLYGNLTQEKRLERLREFREKGKMVLIATDVASRGLDIPHVNCVINYDLPVTSKDYVHRVGRTARAGRDGLALNFVTQYDVEIFQKIEFNIKKKLDEYGLDKDKARLYFEKVNVVFGQAYAEIKLRNENKGRG
jgi:ATP-dependent RNA helicase DDX47/RRP3